MKNNHKTTALGIVKVIIVALAIFGALIFALRYIENRTLFYPTKEISSYPDRDHLKFQDIFFKASDGTELNGWFIPYENSKYTILFCHGNAGNISHRIGKLRFFHDLGCSVFIFDYRGYGKSRGRPSEQGIYKDAEAAYGYLLSRGIASDRIIGYGESIGGAAMVDLAVKEKMKAIILDSTLTSVKDMIEGAYKSVPYWVFSTRFDSEAKIKSIKIPKLFIHSLNDEIIPFRLGKKLYEVAPEPKDFLQIRGGHNSNFYESEELLRKRISQFIEQLKSSY
jgi:fermentation-respiration switch protein FrsA (DUF1100 family)